MNKLLSCKFNMDTNRIDEITNTAPLWQRNPERSCVDEGK